MNGSLNLKIFVSISIGLHLFILSIFSILFSDMKIHPLPPLNIEVSLLPLVAEKKEIVKREPSKTISKKEVLTEHEPQITSHKEERPPQNEVKEVIAHKKEHEPESPLPVQTEVRVVPISVPPVTLSQSEEEKITIASHGPPLPNIPSSGEKRDTVKLSFPSDGEIIFAQPKYAENPKPLYPQEARRKGYEGEVLLRVEVLSNGRVGQIEVRSSSGYETLDRSAINAVKQWKFIPAKKGENPIPFWVSIPIKFQLR